MITIPGLILHLPFPGADPNYNHIGYDSTFNFNLTPFGAGPIATIDHDIYRYEGGSGKFLAGKDKTALWQPASTLLHFGTGDFTIGFWLRAATSIAGQASPCFIGQQSYSNTPGFIAYTDKTAPTKLSFRINTNLVSSNGDITTGVWEHWAIVRSSGTLYIFKDGALDKTVENFTTAITAHATYLTLGHNMPWNTYFNGNLDDVFISNQAVWTSPFTPDEVYWDGVIHMPETRPSRPLEKLQSANGIQIPVTTNWAISRMFVNGDSLTRSVIERGKAGPVRYEPWNYGDKDSNYPLLFTNTNGNIRGVVLQNTVPIALCEVVAYDNYTKLPLAATRTKSDGTFRFNNLILGYSKYFLVAFDPEGAPLQNAIVLDKLVAT